jgi:hypothetical protein
MYCFWRDWEEDERLWNNLGHPRPSTERVIGYIDSLRTPEWQKHPERKPEILPLTLEYRLLYRANPHFTLRVSQAARI